MTIMRPTCCLKSWPRSIRGTILRMALTIAASAGAMSTIRHLTDDHYAADVLLEKLAALDPRHDPADS